MEEREFFNETTELRTHTLTCPKCGQASYMVRRDDKLACANVRCRKPFEIAGLQSLAFLSE